MAKLITAEYDSQPLPDILGWLSPKGAEHRYDFLARLQLAAASHGDEIIPTSDFSAIAQQVPKWSFSEVRADGLYIAAERPLDVAPDYIGDPDLYGSARRTLLVEPPDSLTLLARSALTGEDVCNVFKIEEAIARREREIEKDRAGFTVFPAELRIVRRLGQPYQTIARELGINAVTVSTTLAAVQKRNGMTRQEVVESAIDKDWLDMSLLPSGDTSALTPRQIEIIKLAFESNEAAGAMLGISGGTVGRHWSRILERTGAGNRLRAFLMLKRDGLDG